MLLMKWLLGVRVLIALIAVLVLTGRKSVQAEILIPAELNQVWSVLTELDKYAEWNSVLKPKVGHSPIELKEGETITYTFSQDSNNAYDITSTIKFAEKNATLNQGGGIPTVLTFNHFYQLENTKDGVKLKIYEEYRGISVHFWSPKPVEVAYRRLSEELRTRVLAVYP